MPQLNLLNKFLALQEICETNYRKLLRLIPCLPCLERCAVAQLGGKPALFLRLIDRAPYTVTLELSYCLKHDSHPVFEPALRLKVYLDVGMVEVVADSERPLWHLRALPACQILERKWLLNYFLDKWLDHCLQHGYRFAEVDDYSTLAYANV